MKLTNMIKYFLLFILISGCSLVRTLNMKEHNFGRQAKHVVWFQVAGLKEEHLALLKFARKNENSAIALERAACVGQLWNYNLYDIRPSVEDGFIAQLSGSNDVVNSCKKFEKDFLWESINNIGFYTGILESTGDNVGYLASSRLKCKKELRPKLKDITLWKMSERGKKDIDSNVFHYQDSSRDSYSNGVFFDRSCSKSGCYSTLFNNAKSLYSSFTKGKSQFLFMIRDFSYMKALEDGDISRTLEILYELEKTINYFVETAVIDEKMLVVVSSTGGVNIEFPAYGKEWYKFNKDNKYIALKNSSLVSPVFSFGAGAENFCGFYKEYELTSRLVDAASKGKVKFKILSLF